MSTCCDARVHCRVTSWPFPSGTVLGAWVGCVADLPLHLNGSNLVHHTAVFLCLLPSSLAMLAVLGDITAWHNILRPDVACLLGTGPPSPADSPGLPHVQAGGGRRGPLPSLHQPTRAGQEGFVRQHPPVSCNSRFETMPKPSNGLSANALVFCSRVLPAGGFKWHSFVTSVSISRTRVGLMQVVLRLWSEKPYCSVLLHVPVLVDELCMPVYLLSCLANHAKLLS